MEDARKLLDFTQKLDITLLDRVVTCLYAGSGEQVGGTAPSLLHSLLVLTSAALHPATELGLTRPVFRAPCGVKCRLFRSPNPDMD